MNEIHDGAAFEAAADDVLPDAAGAAESGAVEPESSLSEPRRRNAQARIDEVTRARREAERERDYWRGRVGAAASFGERDDAAEDRAATTIDPGSRGSLGHDEHEGDDPISDEDESALHARIRGAVRAELMAEAAAFEAEESARGAAAVWEGRQAAFASVRPDYVEAVMGSDWACSETMADAIQDSDAGPAVAYHLAQNPDAAAAIAALSPLGQVRALGRLEAGLIGSPGGEAGAAMSISAAPAPPPSLRGAGGRFRPAPDTDDFAAFDRAYGAR